MTVPTSTEPDVAGPGDEESGSPTPERGASPLARVIRSLLTQRVVLLAVLVVAVVVYFILLGQNDYLTGAYDFDYMSAALINAVPLAMLGFAELFVILSGRGGIDLSVGAIVSLAGHGVRLRLRAMGMAPRRGHPRHGPGGRRARSSSTGS